MALRFSPARGASVLMSSSSRGPTGATGDTGPTGSTGAAGDDAYVYIAYASADDGTDFTLTFSAALNYIAVLSTTTEIPSPIVSDFAGLWKNYKGATGATGSTGPIGMTWQGAWLTATAYALDDVVEEDGSSYICIEAHTSGTFATDLAAAKWELVAAKAGGIAISGTFTIGNLPVASGAAELEDSGIALYDLIYGTVRAETSAFVDRLATAPTPSRLLAYNNLIKALVSAGVWDKADVIYMLDAFDSATALTNLKSSSYGGTAVNSPTFTQDAGFTGIATSYINTNFNASTAGGNFTQNSATFAVWSNTVGQKAAFIGGTSVTTGNTVLSPRWTDDKAYYAINASTQSNAVSTDGSGLWTLARTGASALRLDRNGAAFGTATTASQTMANESLHILNISGGSSYTGVVLSVFIGAGLDATESTALYNAMHVYHQTVAGIA